MLTIPLFLFFFLNVGIFLGISSPNLFINTFFINILFSVSSFKSAIRVPSLANDILPVSSDTTIAILSVSLEIPIAALCLVPNSFAIFLSLASGNMHAAAAILLLLITTAPSVVEYLE